MANIEGLGFVVSLTECLMTPEKDTLQLDTENRVRIFLNRDSYGVIELQQRFRIFCAFIGCILK